MTIPVTRPPAAPSTACVLAAARSSLTTHPTPRDLRNWLFQHTSQPNGDPWSADLEHLDNAARRLATVLAGA